MKNYRIFSAIELLQKCWKFDERGNLVPPENYGHDNVVLPDMFLYLGETVSELPTPNLILSPGKVWKWEGLYEIIEPKLLWRRPVKHNDGSWQDNLLWHHSKKEFHGYYSWCFTFGPWESREEFEICED